MKLLVQRVRSAQVDIDGKTVGKIGHGLGTFRANWIGKSNQAHHILPQRHGNRRHSLLLAGCKRFLLLLCNQNAVFLQKLRLANQYDL